MVKQKNILRLNFASFDKAWILNYTYSLLRESWSLTEWKKEVLYFIVDWLSGSDEIKTTTSGSTGTPKTISLKKEYVKKSALTTLKYFNLKKGDKALLALPVRYIAGKLMIVRAIEGNMNLYCIEPSLTPAFDETETDFAAMTPAQVSALLETENGPQHLNKIKKLIIGGDKITRTLEDKLDTLKTEIWHTYGMTETITHIALRKVNGKDKSQYFKPLPGVSLSLAEDNRLIIDAPGIGVRFMKTNDIAEINSDGSFIIKGRIDNVIISGGVKLFPEEMEKKIEGVMDKPFYFKGEPDEKFGEKPVLVIESETPVDKEKILTEIKTLLSKYELPKEIVVKTKFDKTLSGKIKR